MPEPFRRFARPALATVASVCALALATGAEAHGHRHAVAHPQGHAHVQAASLKYGEPKDTAIVMDARTGEILFAERADSIRYPASVTKVMTMYLAFEALASGRLHLNDPVLVSPLAAAQPATKLGLRAGETITVENALHAMAVHSANDMAVAIAEKIGGTASRFADLMTLKAQQLGMVNTRYVNPNGLPDNRQLTSAHDIAILARAVLRDYPQYYAFFSQEEFTYHGRTMYNTNHLLGKMPGVDGMKTGFTNAAGFNLCASAMRNGHRLIAVVMGSSSSAARNANVENLLLTGFDVEDRRDRGEKILATQTYFEKGPAAARAAGNEAPGDAIDVVLTRNTAQPGPLAVASAMPQNAPQSAAAKATPAHEPRNWWVQVGEFRSRQAARSQIETVSRRYSSLFDNAEGVVDGGGHTYRARFSGLTQTAAHEACSTVKPHGIPCITGSRA
jgi:D-alanyl-D-alanine carboxypeptidase (penicillin-binding protein 5/6)